MKKKITAAAALIISACALSTGISAAAKSLYENMTLENLQSFAVKNTYSYEIFELEKENIIMDTEGLQNQLDYYEAMLKNQKKNTSEYYEYKLKVLELKKETRLAEFKQEFFEDEKEKQDKELLNFQLKSKYYELCILENQVRAEKARIEYLQKYADIESSRFERGLSTENDAAATKINVQLAESNMKSVQISISNKKREISDMLNQYKNTDNFSISSKFPDNISLQKFSADKGFKDFAEKNFKYRLSEKKLELDEDFLEEAKEIYGKDSDTYKKLDNILETDKLNFEISKQQYKSEISALISDYEAAFERHEIHEDYRRLLESRLDVLESSYEQGNVSELEYLMQYAELLTEQSECDKALAEVDVLSDRVRLFLTGVVV